MSRIYQTWYTDRKTGKRRNSKTHHIAFRDHLRRRQTIAGYPEKRKTEQMAIRLESLIRCRSMGEPLADDVNRWLMALDPARRERLAEMDILSPQMIYADKPLILHLEGSDTEPGFKQSLLAKGSTPGHVAKTVLRAKNIIEGCGFTSARNMTDPGAVTRVEVLLGKWRDEKRIGGRTLNYYVRDFKTFCRWLNATDRIPSPVMTSLAGVKNEDIESDDRRSLHVAELQYLLPVTASRPEVLGLSGEERAMLYWFAFETGLRPGQIRALKVEDFNLNSERPHRHWARAVCEAAKETHADAASGNGGSTARAVRHEGADGDGAAHADGIPRCGHAPAGLEGGKGCVDQGSADRSGAE